MKRFGREAGQLLFLLTILGLHHAAAQTEQKQHAIAQELVGKWCYYNVLNGDEGRMSNTCITLNADGSYEFYIDGTTMMTVNAVLPGMSVQETDYGKWWVSGNWIFYNSQSHGNGSFQFQKMNQPTDKTVPMIVLNGLAFVSSTPRDPW